MRFGTVVPIYGPLARPDVQRRLILRAEALGYDAVWFADHVVVPEYAAGLYGETFFEPLTALSFAAGFTSRLRLGMDVMVVPYRPAVLTAKVLASLDVLSGGRVILGAGVGILRGEFEALGIPYEERGAITDEYLRAFTELWSAEKPRFEGKHVSFADLRFAPRPLQQPRIPIWVGGNSRRAQRRAAELGDGWHPFGLGVEEFARGARNVLEQRARAGRSGDFVLSYSCPEMQVSERDWSPPRSAAPGFWEVPAQLASDYESLPLRPPQAPGGRPLFNGSAAEVTADLEAIARAGAGYAVTRFWAGTPGIDEASFAGRLERFARDVMPRFADNPR
jgi:probable F420-dependent oxidoreductase